MRLTVLRALVFGVAVTCTLFSSVLVVSVSAASKQWVELFRAPVRGETSLNFPKQSAVDDQGRIYTVDTWNDRVAVFDADGAFLWSIGSFGQVYSRETVGGRPGDPLQDICVADPANGYFCDNDPTQHLGFFLRPWGIAVTGDGKTIAVADTENHRIQIFSENPAGATAANEPGGPSFDVFELGSFGTRRDTARPPLGTFDGPSGLTFGDNGRLAVVDENNFRVQVFDPATNGPVVASDGRRYAAFTFGNLVADGGALDYPNYPLDYADDVAIDLTMTPAGAPTATHGRIIVANTQVHEIDVFDASGHFLSSFGGPDTFFYPGGVEVDDRGRIFVADTSNSQIQIYHPTSGGAYEFDGKFGVYQLPGSLSSVLFITPTGVATLRDRVFVTDAEGGRVQVIAAASLSLEEFAYSPSAVTVGDSNDTVHATIKVRNAGSVAVSGVTLTLTNASHPTDRPFTTSPSQIAILNPAGAADGGDVATVHFDYRVVDVNTDTSRLRLVLEAAGEASGSSIAASDAFDAAEVAGPSGPAITVGHITVSPDSVGLGQEIVITGRVDNVGGKTLSDVTVGIAASSESSVLPTKLGRSTYLGSLTAPTPSSPSSAPFEFRFVTRQVGDVTFTLRAAAVYDGGAAGVQTLTVSKITPPVHIVEDAVAPQVTVWVTPNPDPVSTEAKWFNLATGPPTLHVAATDTRALSRIAWNIASRGQSATDVDGQCSGAGLSPGNPDPAVHPTCVPQFGVGGELLALTWTRTFSDMQRQITITVTAEDAAHNVTRSIVTLFIDREAPTIESSAPVINADNTEARVQFVAREGGISLLRSIISSLGPGSLVISTAPNQTPAVGQLMLRGEGADVFGELTVTDHANNAATYAVPAHLPGVPVLRLDHTPPEAVNRLDPGALGRRCTTTIAGRPVTYFCTNKVYGTDNLPGLTTSAFAPVSVVAATWGSHWDGDRDDDDEHRHWGDDDDEDGDHHHGGDDDDHDWDGGSAEIQTYSFTDAYVPSSGPAPVQSPNQVTLIEKVRQSGNEARVRVLAFQYRQGTVVKPLIIPRWATKEYEWSTNDDGSLRSLKQKFELHTGHDRVQVQASFNARSGLTTIRRLGHDRTRAVAHGLILLRMTTDGGQLKIDYDVNAPVPVPDLAPPVLKVPSSMVLEATSSAGAPLNFTPFAFDVYDHAAVPVTCTSPLAATFPLGTTIVGCSAADLAGNVARRSFTVTVRDTATGSFAVAIKKKSRQDEAAASSDADAR